MRQDRPTTTIAPPVADRAIDTQGRLWHLTQPSLDAYRSLWECPQTGAAAYWSHLEIGYGPVLAFNSHNFGDAA